MKRGIYRYMQPSTLPDDYDVTQHDIWLGLKENTTAHGIPHITRARATPFSQLSHRRRLCDASVILAGFLLTAMLMGSVKKAFWSVTVFLTIGALVYNMYAITKLFADHPVTVTISLLHENELVFPAVTICNMSPVQKSLLENSTVVQDALDRKRRRRRRRKRAAVINPYYCETGWKAYEQSCYYASVPGDNSNATTAGRKCSALNSFLVVITNQAEQNFVESITTDLSSDHFWMGLFHSNSLHPSNWVWWGLDPVSYTNWAVNEPDNSGDCVRIAENGVWRDYRCNAIFRYICEKTAHIHTTMAPTTEKVTTESLTTVKSTTEKVTTEFLTTMEPTTEKVTTESLTTVKPTTEKVTTEFLTTMEPTTEKVTTESLTTVKPTTEKVTTEFLTTMEPTTEKVTTESLTTVKSTTEKVTTEFLTTIEPTTEKVTTESLTTVEPTTEKVTTEFLTTMEPTTEKVTTESLTTVIPTTEKVTTESLTTMEPTTEKVTTESLTTVEPTTEKVTTKFLTTMDSTTKKVTTESLTTMGSTTEKVTTESLITLEPTTQKFTTGSLATTEPTTEKVKTESLKTMELNTDRVTTEFLATEMVTSLKVTTVVADMMSVEKTVHDPTLANKTSAGITLAETNIASTTATKTRQPDTTLVSTTPDTTLAKATLADRALTKITFSNTSVSSDKQMETTSARRTIANTQFVETTTALNAKQADISNDSLAPSPPSVAAYSSSIANDPTQQPPTLSSCCCKCCLKTESYGSGSCSTCAAETVPDASTCAYSKWMQDSITVPTGLSPVEEKPEPQPVEGSKFPERVETRENFKEEEKLTEVLADVDDTEKSLLGTKAEDLILDCQYSGYSCYLRDFIRFHNPIHGNCYIFNSGWNSTTPLKKSLKVGRRHGLHLTININQDEYVGEAGDTAGLRLVIHSQDRMPFPEDEGITIETGQATSIGIKKVIIERQPDPHGDCRSPSSVDYSSNVFQQLYPIKYSTTSCIKTCYQQHVIKQCQCADAEVPMNGRAFGSDATEACDSSDIEQSDCKYEVRQMYNQNKLKCSCPSSCRDTDFQSKVSVAVWPSNVHKREVLQKLASKVGNMLSDPSNPDKYKENLMKLEVYYEEFNFERIRERPSYPPQNYLSDLGGVLGLWLGTSILTMGEFVEFFLDLIVLKCSGLKSRSKVKAFGRHEGTTVSTVCETEPFGKKSFIRHSGSTERFSSSMLAVNHSTTGIRLKRRNSPRGKSDRTQANAEMLVTGCVDMKTLKTSPPPRFSSRVPRESRGPARPAMELGHPQVNLRPQRSRPNNCHRAVQILQHES